MKKHFVFLLTALAISTGLLAQDKKEPTVKSKTPHFTIALHQNEFYYSKGTDKERTKLLLVDSSVIARLIDAAIAENNVDKKDLKVHLEGDDLMANPRFDMLLHTILSKTVSEVRLNTNVFE